MFYSLRRYQYFQLQGQNQEQIKFFKKRLKMIIPKLMLKIVT